MNQRKFYLKKWTKLLNTTSKIRGASDGDHLNIYLKFTFTSISVVFSTTSEWWVFDKVWIVSILSMSVIQWLSKHLLWRKHKYILWWTQDFLDWGQSDPEILETRTLGKWSILVVDRGLSLVFLAWHWIYPLADQPCIFTLLRAHLHPAIASHLQRHSQIGCKAIPQQQQN